MRVIINYLTIILTLNLISCQDKNNSNTIDNLKNLIKESNRTNELLIRRLNFTFEECSSLEKDSTIKKEYYNIKKSIFDLRRTLVEKLNNHDKLDKLTFENYRDNLKKINKNNSKFNCENNVDSLINVLSLMKEEKELITSISERFGCSVCLFGVDIRILSNKDTLNLSDTLKIVLIPGVTQSKNVEYRPENITLKLNKKKILPIQIYQIERELILFYKPTEKGVYSFSGDVKTREITGDTFIQTFDKKFIVK